MTRLVRESLSFAVVGGFVWMIWYAALLVG